ncbi:MAG: hypothetical protein IPO85_12290 [Saprospiraceae bacterium]|uniref:Uncharacterized protein n=1 Tax=Candidatus Defluviibacterium haderslevense TaxID=2981993 RepID=A0A9D7SBQ0_9BACT|nr:hypothetical protein [Candidatus Defluviibacterium haderslevense]
MVNKAKSLSNNSRKGIMLIILGIVLLFWLEYNSRFIDPEKIVWNIDKYLIEKLVNTALSILSVLLIYLGIKVIVNKSDSIKQLDSNIEVKKYISSKIDSNDITPNKNIYLNEDLKHFGVGWITNDIGRISVIKNEDLRLLGHGILKNDMGRISAIKMRI